MKLWIFLSGRVFKKGQRGEQLYNNAIVINYLPIIKLFMRAVLVVLPLLFACLSAQQLPCACLNGGVCVADHPQRCQCPASFLGPACHLPASKLSGDTVPASLSTAYSYFYFSPTEVNYFRLSLTLCMQANPSRRPTLFYVETERSDGTLRETPSLFETAQIVLKDQGCTSFSTHYISVKRRDDDSFRRIVVGLKVMQDGEGDKHLSSYLDPGAFNSSKIQEEQAEKVGGGNGGQTQQITIKMTSEVYLQTSNFSTFLILFTSFVMLVLFASFITYLRRRYALDGLGLELELDALHLQADLSRLRRELASLNPQDPRPHSKNSLNNLQIFMPVTHYGTPQSIFIPHLLTNREQAPSSTDSQVEAESCSICLLEFQTGEEIRTTPCSHQYHRECIDSWCQSRLSCPICRRGLDFTREVRQLYYELLRNELSL